MNPLTGPVPSDWPKILAALPKDKYLATVVILAIIAFYFFGSANVKVRLPVFVLLCLVAVTLIMGPDFVRAKNAPDIHASEQYSLLVHYAGVRRTAASSTVPFQISSGQINFGCGQTLPIMVNFPLPPGASIISQNLAWANVNNSNSATTAPLSVQGSAISGSGTITGLSYQELPFGLKNCPGGGHGELVLSGSYRVAQMAVQQIKDQLPPGIITSVQHPVIFSLPSDPTLDISDVSIEFNRTDKAEPPETLHLNLSSGSLPAEARSNDRRFSAKLDKDLRLQVDFVQ